jgi:hypothetical protein
MSDESSGVEHPQRPRRRWVIALVFVMVAASILGVAGAYIIGSGQGSDPPQANFTFEVTGPESVTITHSGGSSFAAGELRVVVGDAGTTWDATDLGVDADDSVEQGDSTTVSGISPGATVNVTIEHGGQTVVVDSFEVPSKTGS